MHTTVGNFTVCCEGLFKEEVCMKSRQYLHARSSLGSVLSFVLSTADGLFALSVVLLYAVLGTVGLIQQLPTDAFVEPGRLLAAAVILPIFYIRVRVDSYSDDREQVFFSVLNTFIFACVPFYRWFIDWL
jgi:hypothetical protein